MTGIEAYQIWAPDDALWTDWAKPVLFAVTRGQADELELPQLGWIGRSQTNAAVIVDLPGREGVETGLALAKLGYRPVPLYNGVQGPGAAELVQTNATVRALFGGAARLAEMTIPSDAPPAFLLDANRMPGGGKTPGKYDNRWCVFPQDMPSASKLQAHGIDRVIVRSNTIRDDLSHVLHRYQQAGIEVYLCGSDRMVTRIKVHRPPRYKHILYRFAIIMGLSRNAAGGFGERIPEPSSGGSGYRGIG